MKNRTIIPYVAIVFFVCVFVVISGYSQEDVKTVDDSGFAKKMRPVVGFLHDKHNETAEIEDCSVCHHLYKDGKIVEDETSEEQECSECHTPDKGDTTLSLIRIYHLQCKGCHRKKKAGPVMCSECHPK